MRVSSHLAQPHYLFMPGKGVIIWAWALYLSWCFLVALLPSTIPVGLSSPNSGIFSVSSKHAKLKTLAKKIFSVGR
jgi:hypothetical protein